ncbi:hypothetical protein BDR26DRAFT_895269 [Obelidium mucronatum]|nr:hypothetical protein BDR26DRAFT_895267 [Obelidium mucronatum]KAI9341196.1 hypothetical protein BDR26DRAFT_895269 [Obelidium mucronatum]
MAEEVTLSPSNNRLATAATEDFSDDEKYNEGGRASLPAIVPWRHMKNIVYSCSGIAVGTKRDLDSVDLGVYRKQNAALNAFPTTIPYGFQNTRSITHPRPSLKSVLYTAVTKLDSFLSCDAHSVVIQKGNSRPIAMSIDPEKRGKKNALAPESPFLGLSRWIFIPKWKITVIATLQLELKILSSSFENVASVSSVQPVLSFEFNEDTNELIAGGVGNIRVWGFEKPSNSLFPQGFTGPRLFISDLKANEWVTNVTIDKVFHRIFATVDNALFVYDYKTGRRLEVINGAHKSTISTMVFYQPLQYNITACTDGFICDSQSMDTTIPRVI